MTAIDKLREMYPEESDEWFDNRVASECPDAYGIILRDFERCTEITCEECWNREVAE